MRKSSYRPFNSPNATQAEVVSKIISQTSSSSKLRYSTRSSVERTRHHARTDHLKAVMYRY
jgi:superfamily II DNA helicase RecQ